MIKRLILFIFLVGINSSCKVFEDCDGPMYQIKDKKDIGNGMCKFHTQSIGDCFSWNDQVHLDFTDTCTLYNLSYIFKREDLYKKYGK